MPKEKKIEGRRWLNRKGKKFEEVWREEERSKKIAYWGLKTKYETEEESKKAEEEKKGALKMKEKKEEWKILRKVGKEQYKKKQWKEYWICLMKEIEGEFWDMFRIEDRGIKV